MTRESMGQESGDELDRLIEARLSHSASRSEVDAGDVHPDPAILASLVDGDLAEDEQTPLEEHLARCADCRQIVRLLVQSSAEIDDAADEAASPVLNLAPAAFASPTSNAQVPVPTRGEPASAAASALAEPGLPHQREAGYDIDARGASAVRAHQDAAPAGDGAPAVRRDVSQTDAAWKDAAADVVRDEAALASKREAARGDGSSRDASRGAVVSIDSKARARGGRSRSRMGGARVWLPLAASILVAAGLWSALRPERAPGIAQEITTASRATAPAAENAAPAQPLSAPAEPARESAAAAAAAAPTPAADAREANAQAKTAPADKPQPAPAAPASNAAATNAGNTSGGAAASAASPSAGVAEPPRLAESSSARASSPAATSAPASASASTASTPPPAAATARRDARDRLAFAPPANTSRTGAASSELQAPSADRADSPKERAALEKDAKRKNEPESRTANAAAPAPTAPNAQTTAPESVGQLAADRNLARATPEGAAAAGSGARPATSAGAVEGKPSSRVAGNVEVAPKSAAAVPHRAAGASSGAGPGAVAAGAPQVGQTQPAATASAGAAEGKPSSRVAGNVEAAPKTAAAAPNAVDAGARQVAQAQPAAAAPAGAGANSAAAPVATSAAKGERQPTPPVASPAATASTQGSAPAPASASAASSSAASAAATGGVAPPSAARAAAPGAQAPAAEQANADPGARQRFAESQSARAKSVNMAAAPTRASIPAPVESPDGKRQWQISQPGTISVSTDGGRTWLLEFTLPGARFLAGSAPSADVCWIAGARGVIVRRTGDQSWTRLTAPVTEEEDLIAVSATDARNATITTASHVSYDTHDGGRTWSRKP